MKALGRVLLAVLVLLIIVIGALGILVGTRSGVSFLAGQAQSSFPDLFAYDAIEGHLLGRLELRGLRLNLEDSEIGVRQLVLDWTPTRLLRRQLMIHEIALDGVTYRVLEQPPPTTPSDAPVELPALSLPLDVYLQRLSVTGVEAVTAPDAEPLKIQSIEVAADWVANALKLHRLDAVMQGISAYAEGDLVPAQAYAVTLRNRIAVQGDDLPTLELTGTTTGDLHELQLTQQLSGDLGTKLQAQVLKPLEALRWQLDLQQIRVPLQQFVDDLPARATGQLQAKGDLEKAQVAGALSLRGDDDRSYDLDASLDIAASLAALTFDIKELVLRHPTSPLRFDLSGGIDKDLNLDLTGTWTALQWPPAGTPAFASESGDIALQGSVDDYRLNAAFDLGGQDIPQGQWALNGHGDRQSFRVDRLLGALLDGELTAVGAVHWAPQVSWDLTIDTQGIDPGVQYADWPGRIDLNTAVTGQLEDQGPSASVRLLGLQGELRGYALGGEGLIDYAPDTIRLDGFKLRSGDARIAADGSISEASDLRWDIDVPDLADLLPDAKGSIQGAGKVLGPRLTPVVRAELSAAGVSVADNELKRLVAKLEYDFSETAPGTLSLEGTDLVIAGQQIPLVVLDGAGVRRDHRIDLKVQHSEVDAQLGLQGSYDGTGWSGELGGLALQSEAFGDWRQPRPSHLSAGTDSAAIDRLCLALESSSLCAKGTWSQDATSEGSFELQGLPLAWLEPLLPEGLASVTGELSADGSVRYLNDLTADVSAKITPGEIVFTDAADERRIPHAGATLAAKTENGALDGSVELKVSGNTFTIDIDSPDLLSVNDYMQASIQAKLGVQGPNFDYLPGLVPAIETIEGTLAADFELQGTLAKPIASGQGQLALARLMIPEAGLDLQDTKVDLDVVRNIANLSGRITSGGTIELDGDLDLNQPELPFDVSIKGDDFVALNLPDMRVLLSPDLRFAGTTQGMALTGQVKIPEAELSIDNIPQGAVTPSDDIVVMRDQASQETHPQSPTELDITLVLGKSVHLAAMGLDAYLEGALEVSAEPGADILASGEIRIIEGTYRAYSQDLTIERGLISYVGGAIDNPGIDIRAIRKIDDVVVGVNAFGAAEKPKVSTFSSPAMASREVISYLVTGKPTDAGANLSLGRQITDKLSVQVSNDTSTGETAFRTRYRINRSIHLEGTSTSEGSAGDIFYNFEIE